MRNINLETIDRENARIAWVSGDISLDDYLKLKERFDREDKMLDTRVFAELDKQKKAV